MYLPKDINRYHVFKNYEASDTELLKFVRDFKTLCDELKSNLVLDIDYTKYYSHHNAVELTFKRLCKGRYETHQYITALEEKWYKLCNNGGLMFCDDPGIYESYGYDFSSFYPEILGSFEFLVPTDEGQEHILESIDFDDLDFGLYRVKVISDDKDFQKMFSFSKDNVYTSESLKFAHEQSKTKKISFSLIIDEKPYALLYKKLVPGTNIFGNRLYKLKKLNSMFPSNKLIKHLLSSLWGHLCKGNIINRTWEQIQEENLDVDNNYECE